MITSVDPGGRSTIDVEAIDAEVIDTFDPEGPDQ